MKKGKEERRKITLKKGEKALKMHLFGLKTHKKNRGGGSSVPPCRPTRRKLICREKKIIVKEGGPGGGEIIIKMHNIYPCINYSLLTSIGNPYYYHVF